MRNTNLRNQNTKEIKRWDFRKSHQAHMNSDGQYWDVYIYFYGEEVGYFTLCYGREYEEEGSIIMNPRNSWVTDQLEDIELNDLDENVYHLIDELKSEIERVYPDSNEYSLGGGLAEQLKEGGYLED